MNASEQIDKYIADTSGWRGDMLATLRKLILETVPVNEDALQELVRTAVAYNTRK